MEKIFRYFKYFLFGILLLVSPLMVFVLLYSFAGNDNSIYLLLIFLGWLIALLSTFFSLKKSYFLMFLPLGIILFFYANSLETNYWDRENDLTCIELREDPSCVEDVCGFRCKNFRNSSIGAVVSGSICDDKDMGLCLQRGISENNERKKSEQVLDIYSDVVYEIVRNPGGDYEIKLKSIYNCLEELHGIGYAPTRVSTLRLSLMNLSEEELAIYYSYLASIGNSITPGIVTSGLPAGDSSLGCSTLKIE